MGHLSQVMKILLCMIIAHKFQHITLTLWRVWWERCEKNYLPKEEGREGGEKKRPQRARPQCWSESGLVSPAVSPSPQGQSPSPSPSPSGQSPSPSGVSPSPLDQSPSMSPLDQSPSPNPVGPSPSPSPRVQQKSE